MTSFTVTSATLTEGASRMRAELASAGPGLPDAAAQTPAASAWSELTDRAARAASAGDQAVSALAAALSTAAGAYSLVEQATMDSLRIG